jgi:hypothetical protein
MRRDGVLPNVLLGILVIVPFCLSGCHSSSHPVRGNDSQGEKAGQATEKIRDLIARLGSEAPDVRDQAAAALFESGEVVRPALKEAAGNGQSRGIRVHAQALLLRLDQRNAVEVLDKHSGAISEAGLYWVRSEAFEVLARPDVLPDGGLKHLLTTVRSLAIGRAECVNGLIVNSALATIDFDDAFTPFSDRLYTLQLNENATNMFSIGKHNDTWLKGLNPRQGSELFRSWPELTKTTVVFISPDRVNTADGRPLRSPAFDDGIVASVRSRQPIVRAATAHMLRWFIRVKSVDLLLELANDPEEMVRGAVRESLQVLTQQHQAQPAEMRAWWRTKTEEERAHILRESLERRRKE